MNIRTFLLILILSILFLGSCKKEEGPISIAGTVWISHEVNVVKKELHFLDDNRVEYKSTNYYIRPIFGWVEAGSTLSIIHTYSYSYPTINIHSGSIIKMRDDRMFYNEFVYYKQ